MLGTSVDEGGTFADARIEKSPAEVHQSRPKTSVNLCKSVSILSLILCVLCALGGKNKKQR